MKNNLCIQGFYCPKLDKSFIGLKYPLWAKILLFLGIDKRKNKWKTILEKPYIRTFRYKGDGLLNCGKDYGNGEEHGIMQLRRNGLGEEKAFAITSTSIQEINLPIAKQFFNKK